MRALVTAMSDLLEGGLDDAPAVTANGVTVTYRELRRLVADAAEGLGRLDLGAGARVAVYLDKRLETVVAVFAAARAGLVFVPVNPVLRARQVQHILSDCTVSALVTTADRVARLGDVAAMSHLTHLIVVGEGPLDAGTDGLLVSPWRELTGPTPSADQPAARLTRPATTDADVAAIFYTSGSTGLAKGVVLSHRNLVVGAQSVSSYLGNDADDVILAALPLSFDAGFSQLTTAFAVGAHVVLVNYLLPADVVRLCARYRVTGLTCVPPLWQQLVDQAWPPESSASMRYFANTGGRMPRATLTRLRDLFPQAQPFLMYGLTEAFRSTYLDPGQVDARPDSIGRAIPNAEVMVVRPDGSRCRPGEAGELVHRGPLVALGYWNNPERTAERFRPSPGRPPQLQVPELAVWSGDQVISDEEGFLYFVGREDEMIKTSGYRVSPTEVEEAAYETGLLRDAVALGVPDERLGQRIVLLVTAAASGASSDERLSGETVRSALRSTLPLYMVPAEVKVVDEMPRNGNGKFDRVRLREELT